MSKRYWYSKKDKKDNYTEKGSGNTVDLERVLGNDLVYLLRYLESDNQNINIHINTDNFELKINSN